MDLSVNHSQEHLHEKCGVNENPVGSEKNTCILRELLSLWTLKFAVGKMYTNNSVIFAKTVTVP